MRFTPSTRGSGSPTFQAMALTVIVGERIGPLDHRGEELAAAVQREDRNVIGVPFGWRRTIATSCSPVTVNVAPSRSAGAPSSVSMRAELRRSPSVNQDGVASELRPIDRGRRAHRCQRRRRARSRRPRRGAAAASASAGTRSRRSMACNQSGRTGCTRRGGCAPTMACSTPPTRRERVERARAPAPVGAEPSRAFTARSQPGRAERSRDDRDRYAHLGVLAEPEPSDLVRFLGHDDVGDGAEQRQVPAKVAAIASSSQAMRGFGMSPSAPSRGG